MDTVNVMGSVSSASSTLSCGGTGFLPSTSQAGPKWPSIFTSFSTAMVNTDLTWRSLGQKKKRKTSQTPHNKGGVVDLFTLDNLKYARFVSYLVHKCNYPFSSAIMAAEERFKTDLSWLKSFMIQDLERWYEHKEWIEKGLCPCCKEGTVLPVYERGFNSAECIRCR